MTDGAVGRDAARQPGLVPGPCAPRRPAGCCRAGAGPIVLVASTAGQRGEPFYSHYAATKGAIIALTKSLASELGPPGHPRQLRRPGVGADRHEPRGPRGGRRRRPSGGRSRSAAPARPEEIAGPVAFLASDLASYLHGQILSVNGGAVMVGLEAACASSSRAPAGLARRAPRRPAPRPRLRRPGGRPPDAAPARAPRPPSRPGRRGRPGERRSTRRPPTPSSTPPSSAGPTCARSARPRPSAINARLPGHRRAPLRRARPAARRDLDRPRLRRRPALLARGRPARAR